MKVLAIETATTAGSIAVVEDDVLIGAVRINIRVAHAERVMNSVDWLLKSSRISIKDINAFAISIGPGSFTGLRIGLSTVKGFAFATNKPIVPVSTLEAFARRLPFCHNLICPMLDARKHEVYTALYKWEGSELEEVLRETAIDPADFIKDVKKFYSLKGIKRPTVFMGDGAKIYRRLISDTLQSNAFFAPPSMMSPSASTVAEIAIEKIKAGITTDPISLTPFYIRKSEAEIHWKG